jgi:hypothetical protein
MRRILILILVLLVNITFSIKSFSQHPSENVIDKDKYGSNTLWSCSDKHFGYFFFDYSVPIPIEKGVANELLSHSIKIGYTYKSFKSVNFEVVCINTRITDMHTKMKSIATITSSS